MARCILTEEFMLDRLAVVILAATLAVRGTIQGMSFSTPIRSYIQLGTKFLF
jgi:hypothetical protein